MESLLASYASSDEEEQVQPRIPIPSSSCKPISELGEPTSSKTRSLFSSPPQPKSSLFQSLPQPKQSSSSRNALIDEDDSEARSGSIAKSSSIFSSLPQPSSSSINPSSAATSTYGYEVDSINTSQFGGHTSLSSSLPKPKSQIEQEPAPRVSASGPSTKKVVQFRPPIIPLKKSSELDDDDEDEDDERKENERKKLESMPQTSSVKSFLSSIPAPRNSATLGVQATSGSGRRSIIEADVPASNVDGSAAENNVSADQNGGSYESYDNYQYGTDENPVYYMDSSSYGNYRSGINHSVDGQPEAGTADTATPIPCYANNDTYATYNAYGDYGQYGNNWADAYGPVPLMSGVSDNGVKVSGKRGRSEIPSEIIEVKQEELVKNRPREDQVKLTGIAFGPSYQPVSAKGKPSKLHRRKHQIGSLYFDMKQKESELAERRSRGMLTKTETQAKYGW
ncbi:flocculation protein FLO11 [Prosopis cineraria]|uniref:flocculation protein FLO11 n=1 Tax=Prosopis cineraria TaxID=364024 RepID=UPI00240FB269|nr:flocculation protein FLO11 [Prosopis cineraria]